MYQISFAVCRVGIYAVSNVCFCGTECHENINQDPNTRVRGAIGVCSNAGECGYTTTVDSNKVECQEYSVTQANPLLGMYY